MNNTVTAMIGLKPKEAIRLKKIQLVKVKKFEDKKVHSETGLYRYLLKPGEEHGDQKRRATGRYLE